MKMQTKQPIGFVGQGFVGKSYADNFEKRGFSIVRYSLEEEYLGNKENLDKCEIIFVAVPQVGTPMAVGALLHGYEQGLPFNWFPAILNPATARAFASTSPMAYNLLPSAAYFGGEGGTTRTALIRFDDGTLTQPFIDAYGRGITNPPELHDFMLEKIKLFK